MMEIGPQFGFQLGAVGAFGKSDADLYGDLVSDAALGHSLGYSAAWVIEHHFSDYYPTPNPLMLLSHIAAACPDLELGTSVMVLPWYNPLRFAEDVAMLQTLSNKTLHIGIGRGTAKLEYDAFELDMSEARDRFRESWEIIKTALKGEPFTYKGEYLSVDEQVRLRPYLDNRKPSFYGAISSPESAEIMAGLDLPPLSLAQSPAHVLAKVLQRWRDARRASGAPETGTFPILIQCYVADTDKQAREEAKCYLPLYFQRQVEHYEVLKDHWKNIQGYEQFSRFFANLVTLSDPNNIDQFIDMNAIGSVETVTRRIGEFSAIGFNHFLMSTATPGVPREVRHRNMTRFAHDVMPHFQAKACAA